MLKHTEKMQAYLSEKQFVSNLKIVGEDTNDGEIPTMGRRHQRWAEQSDFFSGFTFI